MTIGKPLDLQDIFVNTLAGSMEIFLILSIIVFAYLAARFRMPNMVFLIMLSLFVILFASYFGLGVYALVIVLIGLFVYYAVSKIAKG